MLIPIANPVTETNILIAIFSGLILVTLYPKKNHSWLNMHDVNTMKGLAVLMVIFSHIGYFLVEDHRFLFPLSALAGVGVNLFLIFSGFGLTMSSLKKKPTILQFYWRRLERLYTPLWIAITGLLLINWGLLSINYPFQTIWQSYLGYYPKADLYLSFNSPLWYISFIVAYYLIFPWVIKVPFKWLWPIIIYLISKFFLNLPLSEDLLKLYQLHLWAFPLGMVLSLLVTTSWKPLPKLPLLFCRSIHLTSLLLLGWLISYLTIHSGVGAGIVIEQRYSILTALAIIGFVHLFPWRSTILEWIGRYSYELYLLHWPIIYHYPMLYQYLPASWATLSYLSLYAIFAKSLNWLSRLIFNLFNGKLKGSR